MDWGAHLPQLGRTLDRAMLADFARELERLGCHSAWASDHICWPADIASKYPYDDEGRFGPTTDMGWLDCFATLTYVAAVTENLKLGTSVLILPYRPPVQTAKQIASLDVLSGGRAIMGVGVGWMAEEAAILNMPWDKRGKRSDEQLEVFRRLFEDEWPEFDGEFYNFQKVGFEPKPVQRPFPFWIGGSSPAAFRRVAQYGDAFHAAFQPIETVAAEWSEVRRAAEAIDRDPADIGLSLRVFLDPAGAMEPAKSISGSKDKQLETIAALKAIGVTHILLDPVARGGAEGRLDAIRAFMEDVAPAAG